MHFSLRDFMYIHHNGINLFIESDLHFAHLLSSIRESLKKHPHIVRILVGICVRILIRICVGILVGI